MKFSIIMPTYNRAYCIATAIDSVLHQTYDDFELIVVDDGSTDRTSELVEKRYAPELASGRIKLISQVRAGVSRARNTALGHARNEWIAYADSDNEMNPDFLETYVKAIADYPKAKTFYARRISKKRGVTIGHGFDFKRLLRGNYIDLGVFVHHRSVYEELGGFDEELTRLVDWDLIIRYTERYRPIYLKRTVLVYNDCAKDSVTRTERYDENLKRIRQKRAPHDESRSLTDLLIGAYYCIMEHGLDYTFKRIIHGRRVGIGDEK